MRARDSYFDFVVARSLSKQHDLFVGSFTASLRSIKRARQLGIRTVLSFPIAHHRYAEQILQEETLLSPEWAGTLQFHEFPHALSRQLDAELAQADSVWVFSEFQAQTFVEEGIERDRLRVLGLGVDTDLFRPRERSEDGVFRVIFVGQITQRKGIRYLIDGFLQAAIPNSELLLVGSIVGGPHPWVGHPQIKHQAPVRRRELPRAYAQADVFVAPSLVEGFMLTAVEAMAMGLPVIITENTGVADGEHALQVPIRNSEAISVALRRLYSNPDERRLFGERGRAFAEDHSWSRFRERAPGVLGT